MAGEVVVNGFDIGRPASRHGPVGNALSARAFTLVANVNHNDRSGFLAPACHVPTLDILLGDVVRHGKPVNGSCALDKMAKFVGPIEFGQFTRPLVRLRWRSVAGIPPVLPCKR